eukprot:gene13345-biopygen3094
MKGSGRADLGVLSAGRSKCASVTLQPKSARLEKSSKAFWIPENTMPPSPERGALGITSYFARPRDMLLTTCVARVGALARKFGAESGLGVLGSRYELDFRNLRALRCALARPLRSAAVRAGPCGSVRVRAGPCGSVRSVRVRAGPSGSSGSVRVRPGPCGSVRVRAGLSHPTHSSFIVAVITLQLHLCYRPQGDHTDG